MSEHVDVLIVGAGLSGIGAAHHIQAALPDKTYTILEARDAIGGTWDLFRYPGVRSDSDMFTLGYRFRPWTQAEAIADGPSILGYVRDTAAEAAIDRYIRFNHRVTQATWSSAAARWTVHAVHGIWTRAAMTCASPSTTTRASPSSPCSISRPVTCFGPSISSRGPARRAPRLRLGALLSLGLSVVTFGLFLADAGTAIGGEGTQPRGPRARPRRLAGLRGGTMASRPGRR